MIDFSALVGKLGELSRADLAVALVFGTAGALIDGILNPLAAFTWEESAGLAAAGAVGIKKSIQTIGADWFEQRDKKKLTEKERVRATKVIALLEAARHNTPLARLQESLKLLDLEIIPTDEFKTHVDEAVKALRDEQP
ncbi:MAG: hypothetical protein HOP19_07755 [Acidobacteria bacterium]|nr:hypothetical protein [Acidobacteriota bacterium]